MRLCSGIEGDQGDGRVEAREQVRCELERRSALWGLGSRHVEYKCDDLTLERLS